MKKTLWCEEERKSCMDMPKYYKVTATKIDEIEEGVRNLYEDENGNKYIVHHNNFKRRDEFVKIS